MPRDYRVYLEDILTATRKIRGYTAGLSREAFLADGRTVDAVALRDVLIHAYSAVDLDIVWDVLETKLGPPQAAVERLLASD